MSSALRSGNWRRYRVVTSDDACWFYNLASEYSETVVNGLPVREKLLQDGDKIRAGGMLFHVMLTGDPVKYAPPPEVHRELAPQPVQTYRRRSIRCGLHRYEYNGDDFRSENVMLAINSQRISTYLLVNFRAARVALPSYVTAEEDLYRDAPAEIRREHSLHLVTHVELARTHQLFQELSQHDAVVCVLTDKSPREFLRQQQIVLAWFARPSLLEFHLAQASEDLVAKLTGNLHGVLTQDRRKRSWALTANPNFVPDWTSLGFEFPPVNS